MLVFATWCRVILLHPVCVPQLQSFSDSLKLCRVLHFLWGQCFWGSFLTLLLLSRVPYLQTFSQPCGPPIYACKCLILRLLGMPEQDHHPSTWDSAAGRLPGVRSQLGLHTKEEVNQDYIPQERLCLKKNKQKFILR